MTDAEQLRLALDREAIREVLARYFLAVGDHDWNAVEGCFAPGAYADYEFDAAKTMQAQIEYIKAGIARFESSTLMMSNAVVTLSGDRAATQVMALTAHQAEAECSDPTRLSVVRYDDKWLREAHDRRWRIAERRVSTIWRAWLDPRRDDSAGDHRNAREWLKP